MELIVFVGVQASGKSSFFAERFAATHAHVSLDVLRTRNREKRAFLSCLESRTPLVIDNTNPTRVDRERYLPLARQHGFVSHAYFFDTPVSEALERNRSRPGQARVPDRAVLGTHAKLEPPTLDEGFARIVRVRLGPEGFTVQADAIG